MLASAHWKNTPKFNTPEKKLELAKFAEKIEKECAAPAVGFNKEGISKHIQDFFNEQRRYKKRKRVCGENALLNLLNSTHFLFVIRYMDSRPYTKQHFP